jgi:hypothetical protein
MRRPTRSPFHRPAIQTLERLHAELGGQIVENKEEAQRLATFRRKIEALGCCGSIAQGMENCKVGQI